MPTKNTIVVPCIVNSRLNVNGDTKSLCGLMSWIRIIRASAPATSRNTRAYAMYKMPSFL